MTRKILIITNERDVTTDYIVQKLQFQNAKFYRLNTDQIGHKVKLTFDFQQSRFTLFDEVTNEAIDLLRFTSVYFRRPEIAINSDTLTKGEANFLRRELYSTLEGLYKILEEAYWLNRVQAIRNAENKIYQLLLAQRIGFRIPATILTNKMQDGLNFYE